MGYFDNLHRPTRESLGLTTHVKYDRYNPNADGATDARKSLAGLDYSPLRRITWASFWMGILISMGGFIVCLDRWKERHKD
jgi:MFS transporter, SP family, sugar:H+ symporter